MILRNVPWFTNESIVFLNNLFKWYHDVVNKNITLLEFGGGNSTLYFLQKNCKVVTVENNDEFIKDLKLLSKSINKTVKILDNINNLSSDIQKYDLLIIKSDTYKGLKNIITSIKWDIIVNDGISRKEILDDIMNKSLDAIVILDNCEYCANWGRLSSSSAHAYRAKTYRKFLRNANWTKYIFEQKEGRDGFAMPDSVGWESPNRWATAICWLNNHILNDLMITNQGLPLVNIDGLNDKDIETLEVRCPYDFKNNKWVLGLYPESLDLKLNRRRS